MSEYFIIQGSKPLEGTVEISGAKNSAGPLLAATLLTREECVIGNLPLVEDVFNLITILKSMGVEVEWTGEHEVKVKAGKEVDPERMDLSLIGKSRVSVLLIGALAARFEKFKFAPPGGDKIGLRPITTHLEALKEIGVRVEKDGGGYVFNAENLNPGKVVLREFSVTATEVLVMAAAGIPGETEIKTAAAEPNVKRLCQMVAEMGAEVEGAGGHHIIIRGGKNLSGVSVNVVPDHVEAATFFLAAASTRGEVKIEDFLVSDLDFFFAKMKRMGVPFEREEDSVVVGYSKDFRPIELQALPWPGFPTDILPIAVPLLTQAEGKSLLHDPLYENRLNYVQELRKMGADIEVVDPHRALVFGKTPLSGIEISSWDIRAGASLVVAALMAEGESKINNIYQIDRGYEDFDKKLRQLGADIKRVKKD